MRRLVVFDAYPLDVGGTHRLIEQLARELPALGWSVRALMPADGPAVRFLRDAGVDTDVIQAPPALLGYGGSTTGIRLVRAVGAMPRYWARMRRYLRANADVVAANDLRGLILSGLAARAAGRALLWWNHMYPRYADATPREGPARPFSRLAHYTIASSSPLLRMSAGEGEVVAPPVYLPADLAHDPQQLPLIAMMARVHPQKGVDVLVEASRILRDRGVDHVVEVLGSTRGDDAEQQVRDLIAKYGLEATFTLAGVVPDVGPVLRRASVYVQSSRTAEGFGMATLEAMAYGLPVVATNVGGLDELVGDTAVLVAPDDPNAIADAVEQLLHDADRRAALGRAAAERARRYAPDQWAAQMAGVLDRTLARA